MSVIRGSVIQFLLSQVRTDTEALIGGKVYFYNPGTTSTTGVKIWLNDSATSAANNPYTLDSNATAQLYASGKYRIVIKDAAGVTKFDRDNVTFYDFDNPYEIDALQYGSGTYTQATIEAALTAIGTVNKVTLLLRPGTWVISSNADWSAYTNVTFKIVPGAKLSGAFTVNIPNVEAGLYQIFDSTLGVVTLNGNVTQSYPEWWYSGTGAWTTAINSALLFKQCKLQAGKTYALGTGAVTTAANSVFDIRGAIITGSANPMIKMGLLSSILGQEATISTTSVAAGAVIQSANQAASNNVRIYGFPQIQIANRAVAGSIGIDASGWYASHLEVNLSGFLTGIYYYGTTATAYYNVLMNPKIATGTLGTGIYLNGGVGGGAAINAFQIISPWISGGTDGLIGIKIEKSAGMQLLGGYIEGFAPANANVRGLMIDGGSGVTVVGTVFDDNTTLGIPIEISGTTANVSIINPSYNMVGAPQNIKNTSLGTNVNFIGTSEGTTQDTYVIRKVINKGSIADNSATSIARITTINEAGSTDGGSFSVKVHALITHGRGSGTSYIASKSFDGRFAKVTDNAGNGAVSAVTEVVESASAATNAGARDVGAVTMTVVATSAYLTDIQFTIDLTGTVVGTAEVQCIIELVYSGFITAPLISAL